MADVLLFAVIFFSSWAMRREKSFVWMTRNCSCATAVGVVLFGYLSMTKKRSRWHCAMCAPFFTAKEITMYFSFQFHFYFWLLLFVSKFIFYSIKNLREWKNWNIPFTNVALTYTSATPQLPAFTSLFDRTIATTTNRKTKRLVNLRLRIQKRWNGGGSIVHLYSWFIGFDW